MPKLLIDIRPGACILGAGMLLLLPLQWVFALVLAAVVHELGHLLAIRLCGGRITHMIVGTFGAEIEMMPLPPAKELVCALAGPVAGLMTFLLSSCFPQLVITAWIQSLCNLLPLYPMDGGRAWRCLLTLLLGEEMAPLAGNITEGLICGMLVMGGFVLFFRYGLGLLCIFLPMFLLLRLVLRKIPCKTDGLGLQ